MTQVATAAVGERHKLPLLDPHPRIGMPPFVAVSRPPTHPRALPAASVRPLLEPGSSRTLNDAPATSAERDTAVVIAGSLSPQHPPIHPPIHGQPSASSKSRAFFDVVLARTPVNDNVPTKPPPPSPPLEQLATKHSARKKAPKLNRPNYKEISTDDDESGDETSDESSDEDEPALSRTGVFIMQGGRKALEPLIPTSDVRGTSPETSCEATRRLFETEYSSHKKHPVKRRARRSAAGSSARPPKPKVEAVRKSSRLATRPATPIDADYSATDVSVVGSTRSASVASTRNPTPKPKAKPVKPKSAPRPRPSPALEQLTPRPTSIAHPPNDPPPPAPTHVVPLRPGYNAYTEADKIWFFQFLVWVFRQNAHAGKAEICQDIFQQAPHHRLESWKSYWRDHISDVEECRNSARRKQTDRALERESAPLRPFKDEQPVTSRVRPPPSSVTSSESMNASVRGIGTFYDTIKTGGRRAHAASEEPTAVQGASKTELIVLAEWACQEWGIEGAFDALATQGRRTARQWRQIYLANRTFVDSEIDRIEDNKTRTAATTLLSIHSPPRKRKVYEATTEGSRPSQPPKRPRC